MKLAKKKRDRIDLSLPASLPSDSIGESRDGKSSAKSIGSLMLSIASQAMLYVGAWVCALFALNIISQLARNKHIYKASLLQMLNSHETPTSDAGLSNIPLTTGAGIPTTTYEAPNKLPLPQHPSLSGHVQLLPDEINPMASSLSTTSIPPRFFLRGTAHLSPLPPFPPAPRVLPGLAASGVGEEAPSVAKIKTIVPSPSFSGQFVRTEKGMTRTQRITSSQVGAQYDEAISGGVGNEATTDVSSTLKVGTGSGADTNEAFCRGLRQEKGVVPGKSWGTMTKKEQGEWMASRCDKFFCEPNKMEGKGVYNCKTK